MKLKKDITQTINRLRGRVEGRLGQPVHVGPVEKLLFDQPADGEQATTPPAVTPPPAPRFPEPVLRVYAKDFADHALQHVPQAAKYKSVEEFRKYLAEKLRFNSEATRRRSANYIVSRFFAGTRPRPSTSRTSSGRWWRSWRFTRLTPSLPTAWHGP